MINSRKERLEKALGSRQVLAVNALLFTELSDSLVSIYGDFLHPEIEERVLQNILKACNHMTFELKPDEVEKFIMTQIYLLLENSGAFKAKKITKTAFMTWAQVSKSVLDKWSKKLLSQGFVIEDFILPNVLEMPVLIDIAGFDAYQLEGHLEPFSAFGDPITDHFFPQNAGQNEISLMDILAKYPENEAGYNGVMAEVTDVLDKMALEIGDVLKTAENEKNFNLWYHWPARPYLRLLFELMDFHRAIGMFEEAMTYGKRLILLSPSDNLGVRDVLIPMAIQLKDLDTLANLFDMFEEDNMAGMLYSHALYAFMIKRDDANDLLNQALEANRFVPQYLFGAKSLPYDGERLPDHYTPGDETEAIIYAYNGKDAWQEVPGALTFLKNTKKESGKNSKIVAFKPK